MNLISDFLNKRHSEKELTMKTVVRMKYVRNDNPTTETKIDQISSGVCEVEEISTKRGDLSLPATPHIGMFHYLVFHISVNTK